MNSYSKPLPQVDANSKPFWDGIRKHMLTLPKCSECGTYRTVFEKWCASCWSDRFEWTEVSGRGQVWSHCEFHKAYFEGFASHLPYNVILVRLEEGPLLVSNFVGDDDEVEIGTAVRAVFEDVTEEVSLVKFTRAAVG